MLARTPDRALKACFISHSATLLGAERILLDLVTDLIKDHGVKCQLVFPRNGPLVAEFERIGASCVISRYGWWCDKWVPPNSATDYIWDSIQSFLHDAAPAIQKFNPDVIWTQTMVVPWGAMAAAQLQKPHVWYVTEYGYLDHGFKFFFQPLEAVTDDILQSSDVVYTLSKSIGATLFPAAAPDRLRLLYCNIPDPARSEPQPPSHYFDIPGAVKLGIFSQIAPSKGQEDIVRAVALLSERGRNVQLIVAGGSQTDYRERLADIARQHGVESRVKFIGFLHDVYPALRELDIAVVCSRMEAFGRVGVEPMLLEKPVVYADAGGIVEYMVDGRTGLSYPPGDVEALVDRLERLIDDPSQCAEMGRFGRAHTLQLFNKAGFSGEVYRTLQKLRQQGRTAKAMPSGIHKLILDRLGARAQLLRIGRNDPCPCGSGKRFKHCHGHGA
jgi:glycosyltransferase involved in cell wall biosynthesis